jgi:regulator of sigma E protease
MMSFRAAAARAPAGASVRVERAGATATLPLPDDLDGRIRLLQDLHFAESESKVAVEVVGTPDAPSAAMAAGIPTGARILAIGGAKVTNWKDIQARLGASKGEETAIEWDGPPGRGSARVRPAKRLAHEVDVRVESSAVLRASSPFEAASLAAHRCVLTTRHIGSTITGLFRGSVGRDSVGGPVMIAQVAFGSAREGAGTFLWILAMLSINLMVLNILPIPLLDGGQLALLAVEGATGKPPSEAVVGISQMAGLALLLGLLLFVTFNDIVRLVGG